MPGACATSPTSDRSLVGQRGGAARHRAAACTSAASGRPPAEAVMKLAANSERGSDHIALFSFDNELHVVQPFTTSPSDISTR